MGLFDENAVYPYMLKYNIWYMTIAMLETILTELRHELLTRSPLDALPPGVWRRTGALNTWGTNAIEGNTLTRKDVERILLRRRTDPIRLSSVLDLHDTVFRGIKPDAGQWRRVNVRIAGVRHVPPRMEKVVALMSDWEESYAKEDMAGAGVFPLGARMHFEFESIHPFSDGNGRVGRLLLNLHFLKHNWPPVHILPPDRSRYLGSLNASHTGDLPGLEAFLTAAMGRSLLDLLDQVGTTEDELKPLRKMAARGPYSAKYLGLRAGQEKLPAIKIAGDWNTSPRALRLYRDQIGRA